MSVPRDPLIEDRVAQLQEIRRRRNELVKEMYLLLQKRSEHEMRSETETETFDSEMDIADYPEFSHVKDLLPPLSERAVSQASGSRRPSPQSVSRASTREPSRAASLAASRASSHTGEPEPPLAPPIPEPAVSPPTTTPSERDVQPDASQPEPMEVDDAEQPKPTQDIHSSSPSPALQVSSSPKRRSRSTTAPMQPDKWSTPKSRVSKSRSVSVQEHQEAPSSDMVVDAIPQQHVPPPAAVVNEDIEVEPINVAPKTEDTSEDVTMNTLPFNPPLPIARIASEHSVSEYFLDAKVAPDPPQVAFEFKDEPVVKVEEDEKPTIAPAQTLYKPMTYTLPPLKQLPPEFHRKGKQRQSRKRDKEKSEGRATQEWTPLGLNRWSAIIRANPIHKKVSKASKCLSTREWNIAFTELKLVKAFDRIDALIDAGRWSFRQPKKQRGVGGLMKTHWDYLLDEMRWMRTDFREERKWKMALAYSLAHAVVEWHEAGTLEERVRRGICVLWKPPREAEMTEADAPVNGSGSGLHAFVPQEDQEQEQSGSTSKSESTPNGDNDNSDEDSDEEQEREQQDVIDALDPATALREAVEDSDFQIDSQPSQSQDIQPKVEDLEDRSALQGESSTVPTENGHTGTVNGVATTSNAQAAGPSGLKPTSDDPVLGSQESEVAPTITSKPKSKSSLYAPLREQIVYSEPDALFLDLDAFDIVQGMSSLSTDDMSVPPPIPDLSEIFPDMQTFGLLDVPPATGADGKKKSGRADRDDPNKRSEDTTYMKVMPANDFMHHKTTLLGALQPAKHWHDDEWHDLDETAVVSDFESGSTRTVDDSISCSLFENVKSSPSSTPIGLPPLKDLRRPYSQSLLETSRNPASMQRSNKPSDLVWSPQDDAALKQLVERYPNNWILIAESYNSMRVTTPIDRRTPFDCFDRWRTRFGPPPAEDEHRLPPQTPTTQMTTRGTKRSLSMSVAPAANAAAPTESKKKRRHNLMYDAIRKAAKKREQAQKQNANNRKPTTIHDTHGQYNKMPKLTPAELSRMKAEADARIAKEREAQEKARQQQQQQQNTYAQQQQQQHARMQQTNMMAQNPGMRTPTGHPANQGIPHIRQQINISGQQRLSNPLLGQPRIASSQVMQAQAQAQAQVQAQAQAQARALAAAQAAQGQHPGIANSLAAGAAPALTAHLTPNYNAARANSTSPGLPQQSPPMAQAVAASATSPRPPSAQSIAALSPQVQASLAASARNPALAHYYNSMQTAQHAQHPQQFTPEQLQHAMQVRTLLAQQQALQAQQAQHAQQQQQLQQQAQQSQGQPQQTGSYNVS